MEAVEYLIYTLVFLVLIAFVGVIGYIIYDNYTYKNDLTTDLNTNFKGINKNFVSTTDVIGKVHVKHTSNLNALGETLINTSDRLDSKIDYVYLINQSSNVINNNDIDYVYSINQSSNVINGTKLGNFGYNMNKYFTFNNNISTPTGYDINKKLFEYRTTTPDATANLQLMTQTTAVSGLKINSDEATKSFQICNSGGANCFQVLSTDNSLSIYKPTGATGGKDIYIGGKDASAPLRISDDGNVYIKGVMYVAPSSGGGGGGGGGIVPVVPVVPVVTAEATATLTGIVNAITVSTPTGANYALAPTIGFTGGSGTGAAANATLGTGANAGKVTGITVTNGGSGYTSTPTITFTGGTAVESTTITAASAADVSVSITNKIASIAINSGKGGSGYKKAPNVVITPANGASATAVMGANTDADKVASITVSNAGSGYTSTPTITFTEAP
jgi:hypothetical protein